MVSILVTVDKNWGIGLDNKALITIPDDVKFVRNTTAGCTIIIGKHTLESMFAGKALPNRKTIVVTRDTSYKPDGALVVQTPEEAFELAKNEMQDIFILGGEQVFKNLLNYCDEAYVTWIDYKYAADAFFPNMDKMPEWVLTDESEEQTYFDTIYYFKHYVRRKEYNP